MAVAQGPCPNCGAQVEFTAGQSASKVCPYCRHVIVRTDRDWRNLGKAADLANTPSALSVGDRGTVRGRGFEVLGRVQLDYGRGPWDEFYVQFSDGTWGWMADAQGNLYVTQLAPEPIAAPPGNTLRPDGAVALGRYGLFKVAEVRRARVLTAEGELPFRPAAERFYADLNGANGAFATIDYGDGSKAPEVFVGAQVPIAEMQVTPRGGERGGAQKVKLEGITCPNCGGALSPPADRAIERVACKYCNAISDVATMQVVARQAAAYARPKIPIGSKADLAGTHYTVIGYVERSASVEGEHFRWFEYLLHGHNVGFRWLVEDEGNWLFVRGISNAEVQEVPGGASWHRRVFRLRNDNQARVDYVLGEFYWKVTAGETVHATDFVSGSDVLSRERSTDEVSWSYATPVAWSQIAHAFKLPAGAAPSFSAPSYGGGGMGMAPMGSGGGGGRSGCASVAVWLVIGLVLLMCVIGIASSDSDGGGYSGGYVSTGGGGYSGGGGGFGGFGGK